MLWFDGALWSSWKYPLSGRGPMTKCYKDIFYIFIKFWLMTHINSKMWKVCNLCQPDAPLLLILKNPQINPEIFAKFVLHPELFKYPFLMFWFYWHFKYKLIQNHKDNHLVVESRHKYNVCHICMIWVLLLITETIIKTTTSLWMCWCWSQWGSIVPQPSSFHCCTWPVCSDDDDEKDNGVVVGSLAILA